MARTKGRATWPSEDELCALLDEHGTLRAVARATGRTYSQLQHIAYAYGVELPSRGARLRALWPSEEKVRALLDELGTATAVAERLGRSRTNVINIIEAYGIEYRARALADDPRAHLGFDGEEHAALLLGAEPVKSLDARGIEYDLLWRGRRVDVKTARPSRRRDCVNSGWTWSLGTERGRCDFYFCIACSSRGMPLRYFLIPDEAVTTSMLRVPDTLEGRWMRFEVRPQVEVEPGHV